MSIRERLIDLLAERSPRAPDELLAAVDCPPMEVYAALNESSYDVERCEPWAGNAWWFRLTVHGQARRAVAEAEAEGARLP